MDLIFANMSSIGIALISIGLFLGVIGVMNISRNNNPKLAGMMFLLVGFISVDIAFLPGLLYLAVLCVLLEKSTNTFYQGRNSH
ncbi:hypothetical protein [Lederbergia lenta]|uniref:Uncharacterized protein n=1 Tax=Lederbergia lenta TaxID=1467 RepID=A0A2X4VT15_LEDLE|nr:hypothetical protein [Lederbergia lenta]MEC2325974.1 hypothetical protein [Lederbergia lenta]SQI53419.1 Uncharacterised protein [Lederbergia lenta]